MKVLILCVLLTGCTVETPEEITFPVPGTDTLTDGTWTGTRKYTGTWKGEWVAYGSNCKGWHMRQPGTEVFPGLTMSGDLELKAWGCGDPLVPYTIRLEE